MDITERAELLAQARELIDWLEAHPEIPFDWINAHYSVNDGDDAANLAELAGISAAADIPITDICGGEPRSGDHQYVRRGAQFDRVEYRAAVVPRAHMARHYAEATYAGCVEPEAVAA